LSARVDLESRLPAAQHPAHPGAEALTETSAAAWHIHPYGQTIYVTEGIGRCQREGGTVEEIRPGERVYFEPGENHWHGAAPTRLMTHIAIQEADENGSPLAGAARSPTRNTRPPRHEQPTPRRSPTAPQPQGALIEHRILGRTGVSVPKLCLGAMRAQQTHAATRAPAW
jgi:mannose-6-phosphate isomerase-like protein (cupin superfamily)